ncbi:hypothetical protein M3Y97_00763500 [Aphelenchoides bicaudatus]|nr:hypothetical protein M3Y97_00763500 [Aphelenchoides bicaudatus]
MSENCKYTCGYCNPSSIFQPYPQPPQQNTGGLFPPNTLNPYPLPAQQNPNGIYPPNTLNPNPYPNPYPYNPPYNPYNPQPSYQSPVTNCVDKSNNCLSWNRNGFCQSSFYDPTVKQDYCAATCGLCGTSAFSSG